MSDHLSFDQLHRELSGVRWAEPAELRARARRRSRRTAALAAAVVLVVVSGSTAVAAGRTGKPVAPVAAGARPAASPSRVEIPLEALVSVADLPERADPPLTQSGIGEPVRVDDMLMVCLKEKGIAAEWATSRYSRSQTVPRSRQVGDPTGEPLLRQELYRVRPEAAGEVFDELDRLVARCGQWQSTGLAKWGGRDALHTSTHRWTVVARDFAGDQAVLLRHTVTPPREVKTSAVPEEKVTKPVNRAVVRSGDLVTVLTPARGGTDAELRDLAETAARRMCAAANPSC
ncbi:hypothetical protein [Micromonospora psammae]|uniref:hypothetical protein n=1 Tax=Micromonospora sp. CPCC 205556 TaxID=3122398 RepID=UPI002FF2FBE0